MGFGFGSFDIGFNIMSALLLIIFLCMLGVFVAVVIRGIGTWNKNNHSPRLTVDASVAAKRTDVTHHSHANGGNVTGAQGYSTTSSTWYYVTFEVESGDRMEFSVSGKEYGLLAEGDTGKLTFQGTRYLSFVRSGTSN